MVPMSLTRLLHEGSPYDIRIRRSRRRESAIPGSHMLLLKAAGTWVKSHKLHSTLN